jgi:plasmid stability protein
MANLTIAIDDEVLRRARIRALEHRTSVNAVVRDYLEHYAGVSTTQSALANLQQMAATAQASSGPKGRTWKRDELHGRSGIR